MSNLFLCSFYLPNTYRLTGTSGKNILSSSICSRIIKKI